jgi:SAM-dependent methyltransferase
MHSEMVAGFATRGFWYLLERLDQLAPPATGPCLACGQPPGDAPVTRVDECRFGGGVLVRIECAACGCVYGPAKYLQLPESLVAADYELLYASYQESEDPAYELRAFEALHPKAGGLYLDWGAGTRTTVIDRLREDGHDVWGFEPHAVNTSPFVVRDRGEISAAFDGIFSSNLIEHLRDPAAQFEEFRRILRPGGRMAHATACYEWRYPDTRFHVFFPMGSAPEALAERTGFRVVDRVSDGEFIVVVFEAVE